MLSKEAGRPASHCQRGHLDSFRLVNERTVMRLGCYLDVVPEEEQQEILMGFAEGGKAPLVGLKN